MGAGRRKWSGGGAVVMAVMLMPAVAWSVTITSESTSQPYPGVEIVEGQTSSPSTDFYAAYIELCHDYVHVDASADNSIETSGGWASSQGAQLAVNGDFFGWGDDGAFVYGDAAGGGSSWPTVHTGLDDAHSGEWFYERHGWIAFGDDFAEYSNTEWIKERWDEYGADQGWSPKSVTGEVPEGTEALISGFPQLVVEGRTIECSSPDADSCFPDRGDMSDRHPRTAMGLTEDRNTFLLVVVDGRTTTSDGMYGTELADLMGQLGAHTAYNIDGGGSSQMWVDGQGTINTPSDGSPRSVPNSWGVFAGDAGGKSRLPGSCDRRFDELLYQAHIRDHSTHTDIDASQKADICARGPDGVECFRADGDGGFDEAIDGPSMADDTGWSDPTNHSTIRMGDVTGDGRADICARRNAGMRCYLSDGDGFDEIVDGPEWSNDAGFDDIRHFSTIRLADVTGDGRADLCARTEDDFRCYPSEGDGFSDPIVGPGLADDTGWSAPGHYGTIRMGDVTGDGRADVCARGADTFSCWPSEGDGFGDRITGPEWSNDDGWDDVSYWSTIDLVDLDGDGTADVCARGPDGIVCHRSEGDGFGDPIDGPSLSDDSGWDDYANYSTIRFADVTGDDRADLCARANAGIRCWAWEGSEFGDAIEGGMADDTGWYRERYFRSIRFADVTGDGRDDLCARASIGVVCFPSEGDGFADDFVEGPEWTDGAGWDGVDYYTTLRLASPCPPGMCDEDEDDSNEGDDVGLDAGSDTGGDAGTGADPGGDGDAGADDVIDAGETADDDEPLPSMSACSCGNVGVDVGTTTGALILALIVVLGIAMPWRRRGRPSTKKL